MLLQAHTREAYARQRRATPLRCRRHMLYLRFLRLPLFDIISPERAAMLMPPSLMLMPL